MADAIVTALEDGSISLGVQTGMTGQYKISDIEKGDTSIYSKTGYLAELIKITASSNVEIDMGLEPAPEEI